MEYIALTGIAESVIETLKNNNLRTLELRSPHNFVSVLEINTGDLVLITSSRLQDLSNGTMGLVARVVQKQISTHSLIMANDLYVEERETTTASVQLKCKCMARVRDVVSNEIGKPVLVDVMEISCYEAR